ncbi:MAG: 30S ribosomal protein S12 methylthiotransferase RimO [Bacteroidales bacterium]|nr:30S ribosomal protein S12 methylthiotransferase RimO [Bacteroidales bacterium]MDD4544652.1 30S ribosomal protein S12 methylthiotransferase RimO [Bacteroidales bacterium]
MNINIVTLGCSKNTVDSEFLAGHLRDKGHNVDFEANKIRHDVVIINTCGFIHDAKEESIETILQYCAYKKIGRIEKLIVCGCLSQRYKDDLAKEIKEVDKFYGVFEWEEILEYLHSKPQGKYYRNRNISTPKHYAYLKISEGCDRNCSYCSIPLIRGKNISREIEDLVQEAKLLVESGVKELIIIGQDTTYYGLDNYKKRRLYDLLVELVKIEDLKWIRLQYAYPHQFPMEVIELMAKEEKICKYIDLPLQHISTSILSSMNRNIDKEGTIKLVNDIRAIIPDIAFRTTFIVGYPNEGEEEFEELKEFVTNSRFDRMGAFTYSEEEGTPAYELEDIIPQETKIERLDEILYIQQNISLEINQEKIGKTYEVVIDRRDQDFWVGRTQYDSPEVDNEVLIPDTYKLEIGKFYNIRIVDAVEFDLIGEII